MLNLDSVYTYVHQRTVPGYAGVRGGATNTATVTVNGNTAWRLGEYFYGGDAVNNAASAVMKELETLAVVNPPGTNDADLVESVTGKVYVAKSPEAFTYDDDGNMLSDGRFTYTWDGENRLIKAEEFVCPTNRTLRKVDYAYDHQGRMVWKEIKHRGAEAQSWEEEKVISYLWDNFNIIAETTAADSTTNTTYNIWGLDIDGSMQGAGGVGGLLAVVKDSATYIPVYDANGNVMEYVAADGSIAAHREYDPFGGTVVYTEQSAITNQQSSISFTHWFSTKPWCAVTGLSEYQFRKYDPVFGRWLNRDPIGEWGGVSLFASCGNNMLIKSDAYGLEATAIEPPRPAYKCSCSSDDIVKRIHEKLWEAGQKTVKADAIMGQYPSGKREILFWKREYGGYICCNPETKEVGSTGPFPGIWTTDGGTYEVSNPTTTALHGHGITYTTDNISDPSNKETKCKSPSCPVLI